MNTPTSLTALVVLTFLGLVVAGLVDTRCNHPFAYMIPASLLGVLIGYEYVSNEGAE